MLLFVTEGAHHRHACCSDERKAERLRKEERWQTLTVLEDGELVGVTRSHFCFAILPDDEPAVYARHRSCPQNPSCAECAAEDPETSIKQNTCTNVNISGQWRKCLLLKGNEKDPRRSSAEAIAQRKLVGFVSRFLTS